MPCFVVLTHPSARAVIGWISSCLVVWLYFDVLIFGVGWSRSLGPFFICKLCN